MFICWWLAYIWSSLEIVLNAKFFLASNFDMKDLGEANVMLGIKILRDNDCITLSQSHYVEKILKNFKLFDMLPMSTPFDSKVHLIKNRGGSFPQDKYAQIIGSLMFLINWTCPDIAYAVGRLIRYIHNPSMEHWDEISRLLRYLEGTCDFGFSYCGYPNMSLFGICLFCWNWNFFAKSTINKVES